MGQNEVPGKANLCFSTHSKIMSFEENKVLQTSLEYIFVVKMVNGNFRPKQFLRGMTETKNSSSKTKNGHSK